MQIINYALLHDLRPDEFREPPSSQLLINYSTTAPTTALPPLLPHHCSNAIAPRPRLLHPSSSTMWCVCVCGVWCGVGVVGVCGGGRVTEVIGTCLGVQLHPSVLSSSRCYHLHIASALCKHKITFRRFHNLSTKRNKQKYYSSL